MESDATPPPLDRTVSFDVTPEVTQGGDHVANEDVMMMRIKDRLCVMFKIYCS